MSQGTQILNGIKYVYEYDSTCHSKKKYGTHKRKYIGKIIDDVFIPNKTYKLDGFAKSPYAALFCTPISCGV